MLFFPSVSQALKSPAQSTWTSLGTNDDLMADSPLMLRFLKHSEAFEQLFVSDLTVGFPWLSWGTTQGATCAIHAGHISSGCRATRDRGAAGQFEGVHFSHGSRCLLQGAMAAAVAPSGQARRSSVRRSKRNFHRAPPDGVPFPISPGRQAPHSFLVGTKQSRSSPSASPPISSAVSPRFPALSAFLRPLSSESRIGAEYFR